jgi:potassium uptake TrkH family protein
MAVQLYLVLLIAIKFVQVIPEIIAKSQNLARLVLGGFMALILVGAFLLMLPASTVDGLGLSFVNALFTSTSAVCVTGLIVVDTATHLTLFGQTIIMVLIQLGGIGIITFATFLALYLTGGIGVTERSALKNIIQQDDVRAVSSTIKIIVLLTLGIELIGALGYFISWSEEIPDIGARAFFSAFHAVSAFCNAGFSVYTNSLAGPINATAFDINIITMVLIILGGLGFTTIWELLSRRKGNRKRLTVHSLVVLKMTAILIIGGWILVSVLEWNGVLSPFEAGEKLLVALFQSVTSRTAGFNTIDTGALDISTALIVIVLMSIGAAPSSTAGGLKVTTVYILFVSMLATIQGKKRLEVAHRTIPNDIVFLAISSTFLAFSVLTISTILLVIFEDFSFFDILFEQVSAFMTVGLSRGITAELSDPSKLVLTATMFLGRVGLLTFAVAFATKTDNRNYRYPEESVLVA